MSTEKSISEDVRRLEQKYKRRPMTISEEGTEEDDIFFWECPLHKPEQWQASIVTEAWAENFLDWGWQPNKYGFYASKHWWIESNGIDYPGWTEWTHLFSYSCDSQHWITQAKDLNENYEDCPFSIWFDKPTSTVYIPKIELVPGTQPHTYLRLLRGKVGLGKITWSGTFPVAEVRSYYYYEMATFCKVSSGRLFCAYRRYQGPYSGQYRIYGKYSDDNGATWTPSDPGILISQSNYYIGECSLLPLDSTHIICIWNASQWGSGDYPIYAKTWDGTTLGSLEGTELYGCWSNIQTSDGKIYITSTDGDCVSFNVRSAGVSGTWGRGRYLFYSNTSGNWNFTRGELCRNGSIARMYYMDYGTADWIDNLIDGSTINGENFLFSDKGNGFFTDFTHKEDIYTAYTSWQINPLTGISFLVWGISNEIDDPSEWSSGNFITIKCEDPESGDEVSPIVLWDDGGVSFWTLIAGSGSDDSIEKIHGTDSYKVDLSNQTLDFYHNYPGGIPSLDRYFFSFWIYGANTGSSIRIEFYYEQYASRTNGYYSSITDNFTGWKKFKISKLSFSPIGNPQYGWGWIFQCIRFVGSGNITATFRFDYLLCTHGISVNLIEKYNGTEYIDRSLYSMSFDSWYLTITKGGTLLQCSIYSDEARTNLIETLSLNLHSSDSYRYIYASATYGKGQSAYWMEGCSANLILSGNTKENYFTYATKTENPVFGIYAYPTQNWNADTHLYYREFNPSTGIWSQQTDVALVDIDQDHYAWAVSLSSNYSIDIEGEALVFWLQYPCHDWNMDLLKSGWSPTLKT